MTINQEWAAGTVGQVAVCNSSGDPVWVDPQSMAQKSAEKRVFFLTHAIARGNAIRFVTDAPDGYRVTVEPPKRSGEQNAKFHALCSDIAASGLQWAGKRRSASEWKVLLVSGHAMATKEGSEFVPGLEGEFVSLRESTAAMTKRRSASLIEYTLAFCAANNIEVYEGVTA